MDGADGTFLRFHPQGLGHLGRTRPLTARYKDSIRTQQTQKTSTAASEEKIGKVNESMEKTKTATNAATTEQFQAGR